MTRRTYTMLLCAALAAIGLAPTWAQKAPTTPQEGDTFLICDQATGAKETGNRKYPGYVTGILELRDPADVLWPTFVIGRPVGKGVFTWSSVAPKADFVLGLNFTPQTGGDQSRRVAGFLVVDGKGPEATVAVKGGGKMESEDITTTDTRGRVTTTKVPFMPVDVEIKIGEKTATAHGKMTFRYPGPGEGSDKGSIYLSTALSLTGADLGAAGEAAARKISVRIGVTGYFAPPSVPTVPAGP